ncbi:MAG: hypothetical protein AAF602_15565 [Myxococcota bacterium]
MATRLLFVARRAWLVIGWVAVAGLAAAYYGRTIPLVYFGVGAIVWSVPFFALQIVLVSRSRDELIERVGGSGRVPLLYLRPFFLDRVPVFPLRSLVPTVIGLRESFEQMWSPWRTSSVLDERLHGIFGETCTVARIGSKEGLLRGSASIDFPVGDDTQWRRCMLDLASRAEAIVVAPIVPRRTTATYWEIEQLAANGHLGRTVFVMPSYRRKKLVDGLDVAECWERGRALLRADGLVELPPYDRAGGLVARVGGRWRQFHALWGERWSSAFGLRRLLLEGQLRGSATRQSAWFATSVLMASLVGLFVAVATALPAVALSGAAPLAPWLGIVMLCAWSAVTLTSLRESARHCAEGPLGGLFLTLVGLSAYAVGFVVAVAGHALGAGPSLQHGLAMVTVFTVTLAITRMTSSLVMGPQAIPAIPDARPNEP